MKLHTYLIVLSIAGLLLAGCQIFDPGGQVRRARTQEEWTTISRETGLDHQGSGTKNVEWTYARGAIVLRETEAGELELSPESQLEVYGHFKPTTDEGMTESLTAAFAASTEQSKAMNETFSNITSMLIPLLQAKIPNPGEPEPDAEGDAGSLERIIEELRRRGIEIPDPGGGTP
jgi:hypothetical protein